MNTNDPTIPRLKRPFTGALIEVAGNADAEGQAAKIVLGEIDLPDMGVTALIELTVTPGRRAEDKLP